MTEPTQYCKRLIEVDLPIKRISAHARLEKKSAGHGHLTTLHIWWARRPLSACRAVTNTAVGHDSAAGKFVVDPFAGGGSIPLEVSRIGAMAFSSDLNPVAVLLNKVLLNYLPSLDCDFPELLEKWGMIIGLEVER